LSLTTRPTSLRWFFAGAAAAFGASGFISSSLS
jgi:hypothetical protein